MTKGVMVAEYNPRWPALFAAEADALTAQLLQAGVEARCYHVGSTSIPGACAKPRVDIILAVPLLADFEASRAVLEQVGYTLQGEFNIPFRLFFTKAEGAEGFNLHLYEADNPDIELNCLFRNYLIAHPELLKEYCDLKRKLAQDEVAAPNAQGLNGYTLGKDVFIRPVMRKLDFHGLCLRFCSHYTEWEEVERMRREAYPDHAAALSCEPNDATRCFIFYRGLNIIGYAYWQQTAVGWICGEWVIKDHNVEVYFRNLCLKWFRWQDFSLAEGAC